MFVGRTEPPAPQTRPSIFQPIVFALQLMSGVIACALVALALWNLERPRQITVVVPAPQVAETDDPGELVRYRRAPARARGWEAQAVQSDRVPPINFPRAVKTVRIIPPAQSDVTASTAPVTVAALGPEVPVSRPPLAAPMGKAPEVKNWRYQLQGVNPATIATSSSDLVVIDYSDGDRPFTRAEVEQMQPQARRSRRIVLSYMSIGEAEDYRWYWQQPLADLARPGKSEVAAAITACGSGTRTGRRSSSNTPTRSSPPASTASTSTRSTNTRRWATRTRWWNSSRASPRAPRRSAPTS